MYNDVGLPIMSSFSNSFSMMFLFLPKFIAGVIILVVGVIIASIVRQLAAEMLKTLKVEAFLNKYNVPEARSEFSWTNILTEIIRWFVVIIFLIPTADLWGMPQIFTVLNTFFIYLPNVFVSAVIALVGFVFAKLSHNIILASVHNVTPETARTIANISRWAINVFIFLVVLNQLGVATELVRIIFTGFVAMLAIAGGLAFGLGGQSTARDILEELRKKF
ncbi:hypothetical protein LBMAG33_2720 [Candidatus Levyibacteriota bacterium]|nr:hypothetical protein [Candidatus Levybacteria bacterium]MSU25920.1 hypothetical protein [Candidatus Levybacteria bacterium]GDX61962.1 hypothetical protein LBMAG33_2720 [Candidatus Levybacteria bacterium]